MSSTIIPLEFCRAELHAPTCVIPNGHMLRVIGGAEAPVGIVSPGSTPSSRAKMAAYAHTFAAGPRMLWAIKRALASIDRDIEIERGSVIHQCLVDAVSAAHGVHK